MVTSDYILNENHNQLYIKEKNKKLTYYYWVCYGKIGNNNKIYFIINQKNEIEVLGITKEELNRKIKKKINFHDPRFYMVRFGGIIVED